MAVKPATQSRRINNLGTSDASSIPLFERLAHSVASAWCREILTEENASIIHKGKPSNASAVSLATQLRAISVATLYEEGGILVHSNCDMLGQSPLVGRDEAGPG